MQADVQKERCSLSGESATVSLGTISDNASTKAMAGSILNTYMPLERSAVRAHVFSYIIAAKMICHCDNLFFTDSVLQRQQSGSSGGCGVQAGESEAPQCQQQPG